MDSMDIGMSDFIEFSMKYSYMTAYSHLWCELTQMMLVKNMTHCWTLMTTMHMLYVSFY